MEANSALKSRVRLKIEGRVQGVFFRASTLERAEQLGLSGWVMNCPDGSVEIVAEGHRSALESLVAWCHHGPPGAHVTKLRVVWEPAQNGFTGFHIKRAGSKWR